MQFLPLLGQCDKGHDAKTFGKVWLVGASPGDISLFILKAMVYTKQADVTTYDRLVNLRILEWVLPDRLLINVGKNPGFHCVPQDEINALLTQYTQTHDNIVRLKGDDPYAFGREAEEVEDLVETDIPFEVVPGISSTIGGLTYARIPVTHRDLVSGFHVATGHTREDNQQQGWRQLAKLNGILVIIVGTTNLAFICKELLVDGKSADTPAALIIPATRGSQRRLTCILGSLLSKAQEVNILPPTLIMIGGVVTLSDRLPFIPEATILPENLYCNSLA